MAYTAVSAQIHQALDIHRNFTPKIALYHVVGSREPKSFNLGLAKIFDLHILGNLCGLTYLIGPGFSDTKNIG